MRSCGASSTRANGLARWCSQLSSEEKYFSAIVLRSSIEVGDHAFHVDERVGLVGGCWRKGRRNGKSRAGTGMVTAEGVDDHAVEVAVAREDQARPIEAMLVQDSEHVVDVIGIALDQRGAGRLATQHVRDCVQAGDTRPRGARGTHERRDARTIGEMEDADASRADATGELAQ